MEIIQNLDSSSIPSIGPSISTANASSPTSSPNTIITNGSTYSTDLNTLTSPINDAAVTTGPTPIDGYMVEISVDSSLQIRHSFSDNTFNINIDQLKPCTTYSIKVIATASDSIRCNLQDLNGTSFRTRPMRKFTHKIILLNDGFCSIAP